MGTSSQIRLLLVEDVPQVAQYIRGLLNAQTQIKLVDMLKEGSHALEQARSVRPDVVMIDVLLQGKIKGPQLIEQFHGAGLGIPVVVITVPQRPLLPSPERGIHRVLAMPFTGFELISQVQAAHALRADLDATAVTRVVSVFAPKGGVGKTTIAFNLAVAIGQLGPRTVLIDGNFQFGDLRALLKVPTDAPSILDLPTDRITEADLQEVLWRDPSGIDILLAPPRVEHAEMVMARDVEKALSMLRGVYGTIVVDLPTLISDVTLAFLDDSDVVLEIVTYDSTTIHNTVAVAEAFHAIGYQASKIRYLVNRADSPGASAPSSLPRHSAGSRSTRSCRTGGSWSSRTTRACRSFWPTPRPRSAATSSAWRPSWARSGRRRLSPPGADVADRRPIGVFDSGVGGLTVLREILRRTPHESTLYLGDNARAPYGTRSDDEVRRFSRQCLEELVARDVKALVVACNTSTSVALPEFRVRFDLPVLGVVRPGATAAALATRTRHVGVIATPATIRSRAYLNAILDENPAVHVHELATPGLVPLVEAGHLNDEAAEAAVAEALAPLFGPASSSDRIDTLLLGCTHYPLLRPVIQDLVGAGVAIVDSAVATASVLAELLLLNGLEAPGTTRGTAADAGLAGHERPVVAAEPAVHLQLTTGDVDAFRRLAVTLFGETFVDVASTEVGAAVG